MTKSESRNSLFRKLLNEAAEMQLSEAAGNMVRVCVRPPFALPEADFLRACSRCAACLHACSYHALNLLPVRCGFLRSGTPAMDLTSNACHLCRDWPCVSACDTGALVKPAANELPDLSVVAEISELCQASGSNACNACFESCPVDGALSRDETGKPQINHQLCPGCAMCLQACVAEPKAFEVRYVV